METTASIASCLKNCERIKELKIGCDSFAYYSTIEIECVDRLEVIEIGRMEKMAVLSILHWS